MNEFTAELSDLRPIYIGQPKVSQYAWGHSSFGDIRTFYDWRIVIIDGVGFVLHLFIMTHKKDDPAINPDELWPRAVELLKSKVYTEAAS